MAADVARSSDGGSAAGGGSLSGNYKILVQLFNLPSGDYKRFLNFLRKHDCHVPFQPFRTAHPTREDSPKS